MAKRYIDDATVRLLTCAKTEFLKKGYKNASMRTIAAKAGLSTYTIYLRFRDKSELFSAVVRQAADRYVENFADEMTCFNNTCPNLSYDQMTHYMLHRVHVLVDIIYDDFDTFYLLAVNMENKEYEDFIHRMVEIQERQSNLYSAAIGIDASLIEQIPQELLHLTYTAQFSGMFEVVRHNMTKEQGLEYFIKLQSFFFAGYKALLGCGS